MNSKRQPKTKDFDTSENTVNNATIHESFNAFNRRFVQSAVYIRNGFDGDLRESIFSANTPETTTLYILFPFRMNRSSYYPRPYTDTVSIVACEFHELVEWIAKNSPDDCSKRSFSREKREKKIVKTYPYTILTCHHIRLHAEVVYRNDLYTFVAQIRIMLSTDDTAQINRSTWTKIHLRRISTEVVAPQYTILLHINIYIGVPHIHRCVLIRE